MDNWQEKNPNLGHIYWVFSNGKVSLNIFYIMVLNSRQHCLVGGGFDNELKSYIIELKRKPPLTFPQSIFTLLNILGVILNVSQYQTCSEREHYISQENDELLFFF